MSATKQYPGFATFSTLGYGTLYDADPIAYNAEYFEKYQAMDDTVMGGRLTDARVSLVSRYLPFGWVNVDIGIGGGRFVTDLGDDGYVSLGHDVNPDAIEWLGESHYNPLSDDNTVDALTFWDSLEHMTLDDASELLERANQWVFVSMPVYLGADDALASKHFKPGEHLVYFTRLGLIAWMRDQGFSLVERNNDETLIGREGIESFAFRRIAWPK